MVPPADYFVHESSYVDDGARIVHRRQCDDRLWRHAGGIRVHRRGRGRHLGRAAVRADGGGTRTTRRLDVPVRGASAARRSPRGLCRVRGRLRRNGRPAADDCSTERREPIVNVPLLDLVAQCRAIKDEVLPAVTGVIESQQFIMGAAVAQLEAAVARLSHARHGIGWASGTDALLLPLKTLDLKPGDEVITT